MEYCPGNQKNQTWKREILGPPGRVPLIDLEVKYNRSIGGIICTKIERARFLPPIKIIIWITIGSSLELDH